VQVDKKKSIQPQEAMKMNQLKQQDINTLNHKEKMLLKKEQQKLQEFEKMKHAAMQNA